MPIGTPQVPYRFPQSAYSQWVDIYNRLYWERIIFLREPIDDQIANQIVAILLYLDSDNPGKDIYLYINSPGGSVHAGLAIYDTMQYIRSPVVTIGVGIAASMAAFLLAGGTPGKRFALPNCRVMIHQAAGGSQGQASDIEIDAQEILRLNRRMDEILAQRTGQSLERLVRDQQRDYYLSASEAVTYGLIDRVIEGRPTPT